MLKFVDQVEIANQTVMLRVDFNVPLTADGAVADDARIRYALPTIKRLLDNKNRLLLLSHLGKPKGIDRKYSLRPVLDALQPFLPQYTVTLLEDVKSLTPPLAFADNEIKFIENIRFWPEEKANDPDFAKRLASLAEYFVNDAFSVCHREDASVVGIPHFLPSYAGLQLRQELRMLDRLTQNPEHPFIAILGGSKISTKLPLIKKLGTLCDNLLIGGGMANTFLKAQGIEIGNSLYEAEELDHARELLKQFGEKIMLPTDTVVSPQGTGQHQLQTKAVTALLPTEAMYDIGSQTISTFIEYISKAKTVLWNGPVGLFEEEPYSHGTQAIVKAIVAHPEAFTVIGGGDTLNAIKDTKAQTAIDHISTGGGAMLTYIADGTLPGIEALKTSAT